MKNNICTTSLVCLILIIFSACKAERTEIKTKKVTYNLITNLNENLGFVGDINSFSFIDNTTFVVSATSPSAVYVYAANGEQIRQIGVSGQGPYEYSEPSIVKVFDNKIYLWDSNALKLIVYNLEGKPVEEYLDFDSAISDFVIHRGYVYFYFSGGNSSLLGVYDLSAKKYVKQEGTPSEEHLLLNINDCSGGISVLNNYILYSPVDKLNIHKFDFNNYNENTVKAIEDKDFSVSEIESAEHLINARNEKLFGYIRDNSYVKGLFSTEDKVILQTEVGMFKMEKGAMDNSKRFIKYYVLDTSLQLKYIGKENHDYYRRCIFASNNKGLYNISPLETTKSLTYQLFKLDFIDM